MVEISKKRLEQLKKNFKGLNIAVVGDMMLDCYFWGEVKRVSPEAPVPVVEVDNEFFRFGGAANVAFNISKLGGNPFPVGIIGDDNFGNIFSSLVLEAQMNDGGIIIDKQRPTTTKTRVIAHNQHIVRIDKERKDYINDESQQKIFSFLEKNIKKFDAVILQDYNKGVLTSGLVERIVKLANNSNVIISVDPKFTNFFAYKNANIFKPNKKEVEDVYGIRIRSKEELQSAGKRLQEELNADYVIITLGEKGISLFEKEKQMKTMGTKARKVADVSGAGDTVISVLTMSLAAKSNILEAAYLANYAAGIVCEEVGIIPVELDKLFETVSRNSK